jgi:hypothetical protein
MTCSSGFHRTDESINLFSTQPSASTSDGAALVDDKKSIEYAASALNELISSPNSSRDLNRKPQLKGGFIKGQWTAEVNAQRFSPETLPSDCSFL